jgi:flagellar hook protein FlgE
MSFQIALSGLSAAQTDLNTTANNIANSDTTGFKQSTAQFGDIFQSSIFGMAGTQTGGGVNVTQIQQDFSQGTINTTSNPLNMAISSGNSFFTLSNGGSLTYSQAGNFSTNSSGFVVNSSGQNLQVFPPIAGTSSFNTGALSNLQISTANNPPAATTTLSAQINLPSGATAPATTPFSATDPTSYNQTTSATIYDSLGGTHNETLYFVAGATPNNWTMYTAVDGTVLPGSTALTYSSSGVLTTPANGQITLSPFTPSSGAAPINMTVDLSQSTQFGSQFSVTALNQNGYSTGQLSGLSVGSNGVVEANYTNGQTSALGQVALTTFANPQGLQQQGNASWTQTYASGQAVVGAPGTANFGNVQSDALEASNVDLTTQLVNMIVAQRAFQANAQMIQTDDQLTQTVIGMATNG